MHPGRRRCTRRTVGLMDGQHTLGAVSMDSGRTLPVEPRWSKRAFDILLACLLILVLTPLWLLIAVAIVVDSRGPALYVQKRVGYRGRVFRMLKFRTMRPDRRVRKIPIPFPDRR